MRVINPFGLSSLVYDRITEFVSFEVHQSSDGAPYSCSDVLYIVPSGYKLCIYYLDYGVRRTSYALDAGGVTMQIFLSSLYPSGSTIRSVALLSNELWSEAKLSLPVNIILPGGAQVHYVIDDYSLGGTVEYWVTGLGFLFT